MTGTQPNAPPIVSPPLEASDEDFTRAFLATHESPCPACGYNVFALTIPRCPECGLGLALRIICTDAVSSAWIALLLITSGAAGAGLLFLAIVLREGFPRPRGSELLICLSVYFFLAMIPTPLLVFVVRRPFSSLSPVPKWIIIGGVLIPITAMIIAFFVSIW